MIGVLGITVSSSYGQVESSHNLPNYDDKFMHYGLRSILGATNFILPPDVTLYVPPTFSTVGLK